MKRINKIFSIVLVIVLIFSLSACDFLNNTSTQETELNSTKQEVEAKLSRLASKNGFEITYKYESSASTEVSYATIGAYKSYSWFYNGDKESGIAFENADVLTLYYKLEDGEWEYQYAYKYEAANSNYNMDLTHEFSMFLQAYEFDKSLAKTKQATIAGRKCDVYSYSLSQKGKIVSNLTGVDATWSFYIDQEIGICLKFEVTGDNGTDSSTVTFEVTEFKTDAQISGLKRPKDIYPINGDDPNVTGNWNMLNFVGLNDIALDEELFISDDDFHSMELLGTGTAVYYFKVYDISTLEDALDYMSDYYQRVVMEVKEAADDNKCYSPESDEELVEIAETLEDEALIYNMLFIYHEQLYEISFMLQDALDYYDGAYVLEIAIHKANN